MVAPVADEYVSFAHRLQAASPDSALKLPAGQAEHEPPCTAKPALHLHALLPSSESVFAAQAKHDDEPAGEKVLRAHLIHEAVGEVVDPSGQHSDTDVAPTTGRNLPAEQAAHAWVLFEAGHCEQTDAPNCNE